MSGEPPHELTEFLFESNDRPDGTKPTGDEEKRRQAAIAEHVKRLAHRHGLAVEVTQPRPEPDECQTPRAAEIAAIAKPLMDERASEARTRVETMSIELPDGTKAKRTIVELGFLDRLAKAVKNLTAPLELVTAVTQLAKRVNSISIRVAPIASWVNFSEPKNMPTEAASESTGESESTADV
ncbi:MAG: hypothetical protein AAF108_12030 [Planctomycetota bacterium]